MINMKIIGFIFLLFITAISGKAQEIPVIKSAEGFIIQRVEIIPSLSILAPENPYLGKFKIRTVNFYHKRWPSHTKALKDSNSI